MENIKAATELLKIKEDSNSIEVLSAYQNLTETFLEPTIFKNITKAKCLMIRNIIEEQLKSKPQFKIELPPGFNPCEACKGTGEKYRFERVEIIDNKCKSCRGSGIRTEPCKTCNVTGTIDHKGKKKTCPTCKGTKIYKFEKTLKRTQPQYCKECGGTGNRKRIVLTGKIDLHTQCKLCRGTGKKKTKKKQHLSNPVLTEDIATIIHNQLNSTS